MSIRIDDGWNKQPSQRNDNIAAGWSASMASAPKVLVIGENTFSFHRFDEREASFVAILSTVADVDTTTRMEVFVELDNYDVVVDDLTDSTLTDTQLDGLLGFVADGGGYVGVHAAADLTTAASENREEPIPELRNLIGGHFVSHPDKGMFRIELDDHPITEDIEDFNVYDEPYQVDWVDEVAVHAWMDHPDLDDYPVLWTKPYKGGRVCYLSLGHTDDTLESSGFRALLRSAVEWTADIGHES